MKTIMKVWLMLFIAFTALGCVSTAQLEEEAKLKEDEMKKEYPVYEVPEDVALRDYIVTEEKSEVEGLTYETTDIYKYRARIAGSYGRSYPEKAYYEAKTNLQKKLHLEGYKAALILFKEYTYEDGYYNTATKEEIIDHYIKMEVEYFKK